MLNEMRAPQTAAAIQDIYIHGVKQSFWRIQKTELENELLFLASLETVRVTTLAIIIRVVGVLCSCSCISSAMAGARRNVFSVYEEK